MWRGDGRSEGRLVVGGGARTDAKLITGLYKFTVMSHFLSSSPPHSLCRRANREAAKKTNEKGLLDANGKLALVSLFGSCEWSDCLISDELARLPLPTQA